MLPDYHVTLEIATKKKKEKKTVLFKLFLNAIQKGPQIFIQIITAT